MKKTTDHLLQQEVEELTDLLRNSPNFKDLRSALIQKKFDVNELLLAGFMENEEDGEWGAIVTKSGEVHEYERSTSRKAGGKFKKFSRVTDVDKLTKEMFPAVKTALRMIA